MYSLIITIILIASVLLTGVVLVQNSKGGGLASGFASQNQIMGVRKTTDFIEKATWTLVAVVVFLSVISVGFLPKGDTGKKPEMTGQYELPQTQQTVPAPVEDGGVE